MANRQERGFQEIICIYPGLKLWMWDNDWNTCRLSQEAGVPDNTLSQNLRGNTDMKMCTIRRILAVTGLTFEQAFGERISQDEARKNAKEARKNEWVQRY